MTKSKSPVSRRTALLGGLGATGGLVLATGQGESAQAVTGARLALPANPKVLLFGDSYTEGVGAVPTTKGYAYLVGAPLGWTMTIDGKGGSGYCNPTTYNAGDYPTRMGKRTGTFDLIVLQGGSNDEKTVTTNGVTTPVYTDAQIKAAIDKTISLVRTKWPLARIVLMGPTNPYGSAGHRVNDMLVAAATANALPMMNPIGEKWFMSGDGTSFANPDLGHPNNAGHALIRSLFVRDAQVLA